MVHDRTTGMILLLTDATGEVWLATCAELRAEAADPGGRLRRSGSSAFITVWEVTGSAVVGPLHVARSVLGDAERWTFTYPSAHHALMFDVPAGG